MVAREVHRMVVRRTAAVVAACLVAVLGAVGVAAAGGESLRGAVLGVCAALLVWSTVAVYTAFHTRSLEQVRLIEINHMTVWATAVLMHMLGGIAWMLAAGTSPASTPLILAHTGVMLLGWAALHSRVIEVRSMDPDPEVGS